MSDIAREDLVESLKKHICNLERELDKLKQSQGEPVAARWTRRIPSHDSDKAKLGFIGRL